MECTKCGKKLRSNNTRGVCSGGCKAVVSAIGAAPEESAEVYRSKRRKDLAGKFRAVTVALGYDPDELLEEYQQGWLDRIRERAQPSE